MQYKSFQLTASAILGSVLLASAVPASADSTACSIFEWRPVCTTGVIKAHPTGRYVNVRATGLFNTWEVRDINTKIKVGGGSTGWGGISKRIPGLYGSYRGRLAGAFAGTITLSK